MYKQTKATNAIVIEYTQLKKLGLSGMSDMKQKLNDYYYEYFSIDDVLEEKYANVDEDTVIERSLDLLAHSMKIDDITDDQHAAIAAVNKVIDEFKISYGLDLELNYHDSAYSGNELDDIDGHFFELDFNQVYRRSVLADTLLVDASIETKWFNFMEY